MLAPCHSRSEDLSLFLAKYTFQWLECTNTSSPYLFQTDLMSGIVKCLKLPQMNHSSMLDSINISIPGTERANKSQYHIWLLLRYLVIHLQPLAMKPVVRGLLQPCCSLLMRLLFVHKCRWLASEGLTVLKFVLFPLLSFTAEILLPNTSGDFIT